MIKPNDAEKGRLSAHLSQDGTSKIGIPVVSASVVGDEEAAQHLQA